MKVPFKDNMFSSSLKTLYKSLLIRCLSTDVLATFFETTIEALKTLSFFVYLSIKKEPLKFLEEEYNSLNSLREILFCLESMAILS